MALDLTLPDTGRRCPDVRVDSGRVPTRPTDGLVLRVRSRQ